MKILHIISSLRSTANAHQLGILAQALAERGDPCQVCCLGVDTPASHSLRHAGIDVLSLGWTRWLDFRACWNLRTFLRERDFDVIHAWDLPALRLLAVVARDRLPDVVVNNPSAKDVGWWDRPLLSRVRWADDAPAVLDRRREWFSPSNGAVSIACVGDGARRAIWAFDFLRYLFPAARLKVIGTENQVDTLRDLALNMGSASQVEFAEEQADTLIAGADVVWIPGETEDAKHIALDAMSWGCPVVASDVADLRELIQHNVTGYLVPVGEVIPFARWTKALLDDIETWHRVAEAGKQFVHSRFTVENSVRQWRRQYSIIAA